MSRRTNRNLLSLVILALVLWLAGLIGYVGWIFNLKPYEGHAEGIVILTGGEGRIETGLRLLAEGKANHALISGVNHQVKKSEILKLNHQSSSLAPKIDLGFTAIDTLGNANETAQWARQYHLQSLIIVTAHYHMFRAMVHLGAELPDITLYPYPVVPQIFTQPDWYFNRETWRLILSDYNKLLLTYPKILLFSRVAS